MAIADDDIERIRSTVSIVDLVGQHVQLKRTGRNWVGLCPFHAERTPSFNVREETGRYRCFGCDKSGDVFTFVQEVEHTDFVGSVEYLANRAGIQLTETSPGQSQQRAATQALVEAMNQAVEWYHQRLLTAPDARAGSGLPAQPRAGRRHRPPVQTRLGTGRLGRARTGVGHRRQTAPRQRARLPEPPQQAPGCVPAVGCCSRSSPRTATRSRSAGGSCPARPIRRSTRTAPRRRSTRSRRRCTASTGPRATSSTPTRSSCARATPT